jgi:hypothetical protein
MPDRGSLGRLLVLIGLAAAAVGPALILAGRVPRLGRLPGDLVLRGRQVSVYVPLMTCLIVSGVPPLLLLFFGRP